MKIKAVCEQTGLTDRAVRYYIEEEILHPSFTENYLGRKTYDFSDADVQMLSDIAVLRKFGFSVAQIKEMQTCPEKTYSIAQDLKNEKKEIINTQQELLTSLEQLNSHEAYTLEKLAFALKNPTKDKDIPKEDNRFRMLKATVRMIAKTAIALIACMPVFLFLFALTDSLIMFQYPKVSTAALFTNLATLLPSVACFVLLNKKTKCGKTGRSITLIICTVLCVLILPITWFCSIDMICTSQTTDFSDYRTFDQKCSVSQADYFLDMLPEEPPFDITSPGDIDLYHAEYYYDFTYILDPTESVFISWTLPQADFDKEIKRVKSLIKEYETEMSVLCYDYREIKMNDFICLVYYSGCKPFTKNEAPHTHWIFAYNEKTNEVRYIHAASIESTIPFYMLIDW
ncbi:MAG: MerR family transcriptional regulator [Clostridia bacterium]|nr:MerR family transcriptional regulator [Clostridia bacterium]